MSDAPLDLDRAPIFPLPGLVGLPGTEVAFHFFEPRYRRMATDLLASEAQALVLANVREGEDATDDAPRLHAIGAIAVVRDAKRNEDGTIDVLLAVTMRVRIHELPRDAEELPYRIARCEVVDDHQGPESARIGARNALLACARELVALERRFGGSGVDLDGPVGVLANRLANRYFPRNAALRQAVLEEVDVPQRANMVLDAVADLLGAVRRAQGSEAS